MNLTEATIMALQGRLVEEKPARPVRPSNKKSTSSLTENKIKKEAVAITTDNTVVNVDEDKTEIVTNDETVTVQPMNSEPVMGEPVAEDAPSDVLPEEEVLPEEPTVDEMVDGETEELLGESKTTKTESHASDEKLDELRDKVYQYILEDTHRIEDFTDIELCSEEDSELAHKTLANNLAKFNVYQLQQMVNQINKGNIDLVAWGHKVLENKTLTESIASEGNTTFALKIECTNDAFGGMNENGEGDPDRMQAEVARILKDLSDKVKSGSIGNDETILDKYGNVVGKCGFGYEGVVDCFVEGKKICEDDDECEDCEFTNVDEAIRMIEKATEYIKSQSEPEETAEDVDDEVETEDDVEVESDEVTESINVESFNKVLSEHYNKKLDVKVVKEGKNLTITGKGINLKLTESNSKNNVTKYIVEGSKSKASLITLTKDNELKCKFISK